MTMSSPLTIYDHCDDQGNALVEEATYRVYRLVEPRGSDMLVINDGGNWIDVALDLALNVSPPWEYAARLQPEVPPAEPAKTDAQLLAAIPGSLPVRKGRISWLASWDVFAAYEDYILIITGDKRERWYLLSRAAGAALAATGAYDIFATHENSRMLKETAARVDGAPAKVHYKKAAGDTWTVCGQSAQGRAGMPTRSDSTQDTAEVTCKRCLAWLKKNGA